MRTGKGLPALVIVFLVLFSAASVIHPAKAATPEDVRVFLRPGVEDSFHPGWSQTLGTLWDHPDEVIDKYLDYAILASTEQSPSIGDIQFDIATAKTFQGSLRIYVPREFVFLDQTGQPAKEWNLASNVWTDATNDYNFISVWKVGDLSDIAPGWTHIEIGSSRLQADDDPLTVVTWDPGEYHVRLFHVKAPKEAGVYHFKIIMGSFFDVRDFPIIIVKSELNPAHVTGKIALCAEPHAPEPREACTTFDTSRYGKVWVEGTTPEGRNVMARYYFSPTDVHDGVMYDFWLFGVAPGTYTLYASAGGYPESAGERTTLTLGQSQHLRPMYLIYGTTIDVTVWSKHGRGAIPWASLWQPPYGTNDPAVLDLNRPRPIRLDLYDADSNWMTGVCGDPGDWQTTPPFARSACAYYPRPSLNNPAVIGQKYPATNPLSDRYNVTIGPDVQLDGGAPATSVQFVNGFVSGKQYRIGAYVTGYVMTEDDAWQRTFSVSGDVSVEMDLRRSNWFGIKPSMGFDPPFPSVPSTLVLTATDANGVRRGANSVLLAGTETAKLGVSNWAAANPGDLMFWDAPTYQNGFSCYTCGFGPQVNPNTGANYNMAADPIILEGYSHRFAYGSGDRNSESLTEPGWRDYGFQPGTYDISMYLADMGDPAGRIYNKGPIQGTGWYTIREGYSTKGSIALCNSLSTVTFATRATSLTVTLRSVDWQTPAHIKPWTFPGAEIRFSIFLGEGTELVAQPHLGDQRVEAPNIGTYGIVQDDGTVGSPYAVLDDPACIIHTDVADLSACLTVKWTGNDQAVFNGYGPDGFCIAYPTSLPPGHYDYEVNTYGYVARGARSLYGSTLTLGGDADIQVDMMQGGQIRVVSTFYKTTYGDSVPFNGWVRVEVFDSNDRLVGASIYGQADPNPLAMQAGLFAYSPYDSSLDFKKVAGEPAEGAGNDQAPEYGYGQRARWSSFFYGSPTATYAGWYSSDPIDAHRLAVPAFEDTASDVYGFYNYFGDKSSRNDGLWANGWETTGGVLMGNHGLKGSKDIPGVTGGGVYKVKVWAFDPLGPDGLANTSDDWQSYYQFEEFTNVEVPWGGVVSVHPSMLQYGRIVGDMRWIDQFGNSLPMPWLQVTASGGEGTVVAYSAPISGTGTPDSLVCNPDPIPCETSVYMWLPDGTYGLGAEVTVAPAVLSAPAAPPSISVTHGFSAAADFDMQETGVPVPEFEVAPFVALSAFAASLYVLKRRCN